MMDRRRTKRVLAPFWKKTLGNFLKIVVTLGALYLLLTFIPSFPIGTFQVQGELVQISQEEVLRSAGLDDAKNILSIDRDLIKKRLDQDVRIELLDEGYRFPFLYQLQVRERTVAAYIATADGYAAVDKEGKVLQLQRRFGHMAAPLLSGIKLPPLLIGDMVQEESARVGLHFLVQLAEQGAGELSELDISQVELVKVYTVEGIPIFLGSLAELNDKAEATSQVMKEMNRSGKKVRYMDLRTKIPVVKFES